MAERVVEFGDTRYEFIDGHWWPDVTPQERVLVEELERHQAGMRQLLRQREDALYLLRRTAIFTSLPSHLLDDIDELLAEVDQ